ncbi:hypothetical protein HMPREF0591_4864 [Mycobacterium parascrofulaceum ATCC BAA-614]|uniref:Uncharacterized protein n=1 Tax=Mycobacterium parascrofulaceum ATCC BAA-614 TaxID=525368 RepID=D5PFB6_9MYCO|nr:MULTISPECIES: hypothetical protein [Mycobacterium]EFG75186.1 hypothetical protein HMPREF0591_4864 [Mycobacterium parascrofulaceum ATCC BAA-614]OCB42186.1 hypothetical protein A9X02_01810 [Mycobacterium malmoense]
MRPETDEWLAPLIAAANHSAIDVPAVVLRASMSAAEADDPAVDRLARTAPAGARLSGIDWVRFGQLQRHELGWETTYPACPGFPERRHLA